MKKRTGLSMFLVSLLFAGSLGGLTGCGNDGPVDESGNKINLASTTELNVVVYEGGLGYDWAQNAANKFYTKYKNESFEPGKRGCYVNVIPQKEGLDETTLAAGLEAGTVTSDIFYTSMSNIKDFTKKNLSMDILDILAEKCYDDDGELTESGATKSILSKLKSFYKEGWAMTDSSGVDHYYALPYEWNLYAFNYNYDMFKEYGLLNYSGLDGTPKTTDEFLDLLDDLYNLSIKGFTHQPYDAPWYTQNFNYGFLRQYEGKDEAILNYTYDGVATFDAGTFDAETCQREGIVTESDGTQSVTITPENAYLLNMQSGKKALFDFLSKINTTAYCDSSLAYSTHSYTKAQSNFVMSDSSVVKEKIAMIFEGDYFEREAKTFLDSLGEREPGKGYGKTEYRAMPIPQDPDGKNEDGYVFMTGGNTVMFVNAKSQSKKDAIRKWLQFTYSDSALNDYITFTGVCPAFDFKLTEETKVKITPYSYYCYQIKNQNYIDEKTGEKAEITLDCIVTEVKGKHQFTDYKTVQGYGSMYKVNNTQAIWKLFYEKPNLRGKGEEVFNENFGLTKDSIQSWKEAYEKYWVDYNPA